MKIRICSKNDNIKNLKKVIKVIRISTIKLFNFFKKKVLKFISTLKA